MPNDNDGGSFFKNALIGAPVIAGAVSSIGKIRSSWSEMIQDAAPSQLSQANEVLKNFAEHYSTGEITSEAKEYFSKKIGTVAADTKLTAGQVKEIATRLATSIDPTGHLTSVFSRRLSDAKTGEEALKDISEIFKTHPRSVYMQRTISAFTQDISYLSERVAKGLSINPQGLGAKVSRRRTSLEIGQLDSKLADQFRRMEKITGGTVKLTSKWREDVLGEQMEAVLSGGKLGSASMKLRIPRTSNAHSLVTGPFAGMGTTITKGATQQSTYLTGVYGLVDNGMMKESFNHEQYMAWRANEELIPKLISSKRLKQREINTVTRQFESEVIKSGEWLPSLGTGLHEGLDEYIRQNAARVHLFKKGEDGIVPITPYEYAEAVESGISLPGGGSLKVFPGTSPNQIAKGVASLQNPTTFSKYLIPSAGDFGRRPQQYIRHGFSPSVDALVEMEANTIQKSLSWAAAEGGVKTPLIEAAFVSAKHGQALQGLGVSSEGQLLVSREMNKMRGVEGLSQFEIASKVEGWKTGEMVSKGTLLGYDAQGRPVSLPQNTFLTAATTFEDEQKKQFTKIMGFSESETLDWAKVYGGAKGIAAPTTKRGILDILGRVGVTGETVGDVAAVISMEELRKDRGLHFNQMITSLWEFSKTNMESGKHMATLGSNFVNDPTKIIAKMNRVAIKENIRNDELLIRKLFGIARSSKLSAEQMGRVFGAVPDIYGKGWENIFADRLNEQELLEINRGVATGRTQLWFAGSGPETGAGNMATMEPRGFEMLSAPHFGSVGNELKQDIAHRLMSQHPERLYEQKELMSSLSSISSLGKREGSLSAASVLESAGENLLPTSGTNMKISGLGDIYIPGSTTMNQLSSYQTESKMTVDSPLAHSYRDVIEAANEYEKGNLTKDLMKKELENLTSNIGQAVIGTVTSKGGVLRNRIPGSMALRAVETTAEYNLSTKSVGITGPYAERMFSQMEELGIYAKDDIASMRENFFKKGVPIAGVLERHPMIGPYSSQLVQFQKIEGDRPIAMFNERRVNAIAVKGRLGAAEEEEFSKLATNAFRGGRKSLGKLQEMGAEITSNPLRLSPLVGSAGDTDGDVVSAIFAGPQLTKQIEKELLNPASTQLYEEYILRSQYMKAKAAGAGAANISEAMKGSVFKLGITKGNKLGAISNEMAMYKASVLSGAGGLSAKSQMNALGLLEWMEQTPISAKHVATGEEESLLNLLNRMHSSLAKKNVGGLISTVNEVMGAAKETGIGSMHEGITIATDEIKRGTSETRFIPGLDMERGAADIVKSRGAFERSEAGGVTASRLRQIYGKTGKTLTSEEALRLMSKETMAQSPLSSFVQNFAKAEGSPMAAASERALSSLNKMAAMGKGMLSHAKPLAIGVGVAVGIAMALSDPPRMLPPGANTPPRPNLSSGSGGSNVGPEGLHPNEGVQGRPTVSNFTPSGNTARIAANPGYNVSISGNVSRPTDYEGMSGRMRSVTGSNSRSSTLIRDDRKSLTPQKLSSLIRGR